MKLKIYNNKSSNNTINKDIEYVDEFEIKLKDGTYLYEPTILFKRNVFPIFNYCYIDVFKRYYFVNDVKTIRNNLFEIFLICDVLESFKTDILNSPARVAIQSDYNKYYNDDYKNLVDFEEHIFKSDYTMPLKTTTVLSTLGGV